ELRMAWQLFDFSRQPDRLLDMVTRAPAAMLRLPDAGHLRLGALGDFIAIRGAGEDVRAPANTRRADVALVGKGGVPQIGDPDIMAQFTDTPAVPAVLDGRPKAIHRALAERLVKCRLAEPGLSVEADALGSRRLFSLKAVR